MSTEQAENMSIPQNPLADPAKADKALARLRGVFNAIDARQQRRDDEAKFLEVFAKPADHRTLRDRTWHHTTPEGDEITVKAMHRMTHRSSTLHWTINGEQAATTFVPGDATEDAPNWADVDQGLAPYTRPNPEAGIHVHTTPDGDQWAAKAHAAMTDYRERVTYDYTHNGKPQGRTFTSMRYAAFTIATPPNWDMADAGVTPETVTSPEGRMAKRLINNEIRRTLEQGPGPVQMRTHRPEQEQRRSA